MGEKGNIAELLSSPKSGEETGSALARSLRAPTGGDVGSGVASALPDVGAGGGGGGGGIPPAAAGLGAAGGAAVVGGLASQAGDDDGDDPPPEGDDEGEGQAPPA